MFGHILYITSAHQKMKHENTSLILYSLETDQKSSKKKRRLTELLGLDPLGEIFCLVLDDNDRRLSTNDTCHVLRVGDFLLDPVLDLVGRVDNPLLLGLVVLPLRHDELVESGPGLGVFDVVLPLELRSVRIFQQGFRGSVLLDPFACWSLHRRRINGTNLLELLFNVLAAPYPRSDLLAEPDRLEKR
jgi:hypothetical protein